MKRIRYYKLRALLRERDITLEGLRQRLELLPSDIVKIQTERLLDPEPLSLICKFFDCDVLDILDILSGEETEIFYSREILEKHSYVPKTYRKKEFKSDVFQ